MVSAGEEAYLTSENEDVPLGLTFQETYRPCGIKLAVNL